MKKTAFLKLIDSLAGSLLCKLCGRLPSIAVDNEKVQFPERSEVRRILVVRPGGMGDMIVLLPMISRLHEHFTNARIDIVCERRNLEILKLSGAPCETLVYDANPISFLLALKKGSYDLAIDTEQFHNFSALFSLLSGASVRIGFKINPRRNPLYTHLVNYAPDGPEGEQFMRLLDPIAVPSDAYRLAGMLEGPNHGLSPELTADIDRLCGGKPLAILHIGASTPYKRWSRRRFIEVTREIRQQHGFAVALIGSREDRQSVHQIVEEAGGDGFAVAGFAGRLSIGETAALMKRAVIFIGCDSGMAHLAIACGLRTVVLFGPSDHLKWGTDDDRHATVRRTLPCSPCFIFGYHKPCRSFACMSGIEVDDVLAACRRILESG